MAEKENSSDSDGPIIDDNIIRIQLKKPTHKKWELRTRNLSPGIKFPTIQLFDAEGNLLVETNDENVSIKSLDCSESKIKSSQSLREKDYKHIIRKKYVRKHNTISGDNFYTRVYSNPVEIKNNCSKQNEYHIVKDNCIVTNIPSKLTINNNLHNLQVNSLDTTPFHSEGPSEASSYKSSDNETCQDLTSNNQLNERKTGVFENDYCSSHNSENTSSISLEEFNECNNDKSERQDNICLGLQTSQSFDAVNIKKYQKCFDNIQRSKSNIIYNTPPNKVSFLNTYLKSLPMRASPNPDWFTSHLRQTTSRNKSLKTNRKESVTFYSQKNIAKYSNLEDNTTENDFMNISTDVAADCEMKKRLKMYRRGISEIESRCATSCLLSRKRRHSVSGALGLIRASSSSESVDEADVVLYRLKRRILKNKLREKRRSFVSKTSFDQGACKDNGSEYQDDWRNAVGGAFVRSRLAMGSNISQHSAKGLKGRRARSSGDLCNGETKSQTESSVCGSVVGDVMGWNRSLPNHLDGNRHLADYSRVNNNYGDFGTYRSHPKGGRGLRYRISKSGSNAEPVWKLQDPGFDQGYGSERSPEEDFIPPIVPPISIEQYEAELRTVYPFITNENTFTVVVEKDGRGLGMSVCGGGLVRIRRLYPPQPAWRTGRLAPKDLLLSANGVPLAGLSTYEALEVLRTASARVELRVCRAPTDLLESVTPPDPPTPPARTPHPQHLPLDPLNCHPLHARLSQTTSSATSSSEGRGRRDASPEAGRLVQDLDLPELDQHLPVYDIQYGEFDIVMTKVNGSLGFTLRKEDHSALGHYVRALVREPALSDGRVQPGDRIVAVNDTAMSSMSHAEAVAFLRACGSEVRLRLYRDHAATPLSPMSPKEDGHTDSDAPFNRPKPPLRAEAVSMLCDLAARRLAPDATARSPAASPRRARKLTKDHHCERTHDVSSFATLETHTKRESFKRSETAEYSSYGTEQCTINRRATLERSASASNTDMLTVLNNTRIEEPKRRIPLASPTVPPTCRKQKLSLTVPPHGYELNNLDNDQLDAPNLYQENITLQRFAEPAFPIDSDEPVSMPTELSSDERFKHSCPAYQSAVLHSTTNESTSDGHKDDGNGLKKRKTAAPLPDNDRKAELPLCEVPPKPKETKEMDTVQKENVKPERQAETTSTEPTIVTVELNRGWNSRLGFSVRSHPESAQSYISAVHGDSAAARDGRLRRGDVILQVNDENVTSMKTPEVIDLLRLLRGSICITVLRPANV